MQSMNKDIVQSYSKDCKLLRHIFKVRKGTYLKYKRTYSSRKRKGRGDKGLMIQSTIRFMFT